MIGHCQLLQLVMIFLLQFLIFFLFYIIKKNFDMLLKWLWIIIRLCQLTHRKLPNWKFQLKFFMSLDTRMKVAWKTCIYVSKSNLKFVCMLSDCLILNFFMEFMFIERLGNAPLVVTKAVCTEFVIVW